VARVTREGVYPATGDEGALREGCVRRPASQGVGSVDGSNNCVFEVQRLAPSGDRAVKGREARGAALKGARARRSVDGAVKGNVGRAGDWRMRALMRRSLSWVAARR